MTRYRLTGRIEGSELSELYAATRGDSEAVVIKLFHARTSDVRYAQELAETARLLGPVKARGIIRFIDVGLVKEASSGSASGGASGRLAVVRQAVDGVTLGQILIRLTSKEFILPAPLALGLAIQVLETVQQAHEKGAIHGALTPGNVLVHPDGYPAIFDFGALKALQAVPGLKKSFAGRGRDAYRAPEVVKGDTPSVESDIYSVGAIVYELLTLREPIGDRTGTMSTRAAGLPPPSRLDRRLNARLDPIVMRALEASEARRFRSAGEFASALRNFLANNGGMPHPDELRRFLEAIRARDTTLSLGPVPFSEPFTLREVRGADLPPVTERTQIVELRPSFSGPRAALVDDEADAQDPFADTREAPPAFEEYREPTHASGTTDPAATAPRFMPPGGDSRTVTTAPRGMQEPRFDEGTDPGQAGPLERGWEAPPGAAPPKPRTARHAQPVLASRPVARHPRVKFIEDFSQPPTEMGEAEEKTSRASAVAEMTPTPPSEPRERAPRPSGPKGLLPPPPRDLRALEITGPLQQVALPPDTNQQIPRALNTAERFLAEDSRRRKRMLLLALGLAFVGAFSFALAIRRYGGRSEPPIAEVSPPPVESATEPYDPAYQTVNGALKKYFRNEGEQGAGQQDVAPPVDPARDPAAGADEYHRPPPRDRAAFLTLSSDVPAIVYIDDLKVRKRTPIVRYPVHPGRRRIVVEAVDTGDRRQFELAMERGQLRKVDERFNPVTRPRR